MSESMVFQRYSDAILNCVIGKSASAKRLTILIKDLKKIKERDLPEELNIRKMFTAVITKINKLEKIDNNTATDLICEFYEIFCLLDGYIYDNNKNKK